MSQPPHPDDDLISRVWIGPSLSKEEFEAALQRDAQKYAALGRALERFHREGPFVFEDCEDARLLDAVGKQVTYVDEDSIILTDSSS